MQIKTRVFGEVTIDDEKTIHFPGGIIGFPELQDFALIHDEEKGTDTIHWSAVFAGARFCDAGNGSADCASRL